MRRKTNVDIPPAPLQMRRAKIAAWMAVLIVVGVACVIVACGVGSATSFGFVESIQALVGNGTQGQRIIVQQLRLPRALLAFFVGGALAAAGVMLQALFQNPMADPHILGVSAGAGLGATVAMVFGIHMVGMNVLWARLGTGMISICAFAGGLAAVLLVYMLSQVGGRTSITGLLLSGVVIGTLLSAVMSLLMIFNRDKMEHVILWTMGSFSSANWTKVMWAVPLILIAMVLCWILARDMNLMLFGEAQARVMGVETRKVRLWTLALTTLMTAGAVAMSGIIGFVGLIVPHAVRLLTGPDHRVLVPFAFVGGGIFMLVMDTLARTLISPMEIPVGVLTALCGGPFFLYLLRSRKQVT